MSENNSLIKQITVEAPIEKAFRVFTEGFDSWWPRAHHIGKSNMKQAIFEAKPNGKWYELGEDGSTCQWGRVLLWEPPKRFILSWQITEKWKYDPNFVTEVEVTFEPQGANRTIVSLEHRNLDRFGAAAEQIRNTFNSDGGWLGLLKLFAAEAAGDSAEKKRLLATYDQQEA